MNSAIKKLPALSSSSVEGLIALKGELSEFHAQGYTRRMGASGPHSLSTYAVNKIEKNPLAIRKRFRELMPEAHVSRALTEYFLILPPSTGFLDRQTSWLDTGAAMQMFSYALQDQSVWIDEKVGPVYLNANNIESYFGHTVWQEGNGNALLNGVNADDWINRVVNVRKPMQEYALKKGEGISFSVNAVHELKQSDAGQLWACIGTMPY